MGLPPFGRRAPRRESNPVSRTKQEPRLPGVLVLLSTLCDDAVNEAQIHRFPGGQKRVPIQHGLQFFASHA